MSSIYLARGVRPASATYQEGLSIGGLVLYLFLSKAGLAGRVVLYMYMHMHIFWREGKRLAQRPT